MFTRVFVLQCRRFLTSPLFWICSVLLTVVLLINSVVAFDAIPSGADLIYAYEIASTSTEAVVLTFLPSLPFALSYMEEKREHSLRFSYVRHGVGGYVAAKYIAVILSGFGVLLFGSLLYIFVLMWFMPLIDISAGVSEAIGIAILLENKMGGTYLSAVVFCQALSAALFTSFTFFFSMLIRERYTVMVLPYLCYRISLFFQAIFKLDIDFRILLLGIPSSYSPFGGVGKKLLFVLMMLLLIGIFAVKKAERDVLNG